MKKVLIDNGHGWDTAGKRSPDGMLREGIFARDIARRLGVELEERGVPYQLITPEKEDTPLATRVHRANEAHKQYAEGTILISLHSDACQGKGWHKARGMSVHVAPNASQNSKTLARCLYSSWENLRLKARKYKGDTQPYWTQNLAICRDTKMPAVLVEMFFHDNEDDVAWALSESGKEMLVKALADGVCSFVK